MRPIYANVASDPGPSGGIWGRCSADVEPGMWATIWEDFILWDATAGSASRLSSVVDSNATVALTATEVGGVVRLSTYATANNEASVVSGDNTAGFCKFTAGKRLFFECRMRVQQIANSIGSIFVGLTQEAMGAANMITDDDILADADYVGWQMLTADGDQMEPVYSTYGGTARVVKADAKTLVADTWYKFGFYCVNDRITYTINGVPITNTTLAHPVSIGTTDVPDGEELQVTCCVKAYTTTDTTFDLDWVKVAYER